MKKTFVLCITICCLFFILSSFSCDSAYTTIPPQFFRQSESGLTIISWNLQEFFDAVDTGTEYEDYSGSKSCWSEEKYLQRLKRLCSLMESTDADIWCFMEVENEAVLHDISNMLHMQHSLSVPYPYAAFSRGNKGCIGCGILSRYPLEKMTVHSAQFTGTLPAVQFKGYETGIAISPPVMRPMLEITLAPFEEGKNPLKIFINHWKSKSSGGRESDVWRNTQENVLAYRIQKALEEGFACIAVGDFNRNLNEFTWTHRTPEQVQLRSLFSKTTVDSPWFGSKDPGSYYYDGSWNTLDHVFLCGPIRVVSFETLTRGNLATDSGYPNGYNVWKGEGFSDHFPLKVKIQYTNH